MARFRADSKMLQKVLQTISDHRMLRSGDSVLIGVSGGPDSVALFHLFLLLQDRWQLRFGIIHVNHLIRGTKAFQDQQFVADLATRYGVDYYPVTEDVKQFQELYGGSLEEAGRKVRYAWFEKIARTHGYEKIALGHHADDNAEWLLMNLIRGTGPEGIAGIPPVRQGIFIRPLIRVFRDEIMEFLKTNGIEYRIDETNMDTAFFRNHVRHQVIPEIEKAFNPRFRFNLQRLSEIVQCENQWIDQWVDDQLSLCIRETGKDFIDINGHQMTQWHRAAQRRMIREILKRLKGNCFRITFDHVEAIVKLLNTPGTGHLDLPDGIRIDKSGPQVIFSQGSVRPGSESGTDFYYEIPEPGSYSLDAIESVIRVSEIKPSSVHGVNTPNQYTAWFDKDKLVFPLIVRNPRPGDRFHPLGMQGHQKLKKFFINCKIPATQRQTCPVLISDHRIIWVMGHRTDETAKITEKTQSVLKAELFLA